MCSRINWELETPKCMQTLICFFSMNSVIEFIYGYFPITIVNFPFTVNANAQSIWRPFTDTFFSFIGVLFIVRIENHYQHQFYVYFIVDVQFHSQSFIIIGQIECCTNHMCRWKKREENTLLIQKCTTILHDSYQMGNCFCHIAA